jgi:GNAT superfamily N-acetyltransferase
MPPEEGSRVTEGEPAPGSPLTSSLTIRVVDPADPEAEALVADFFTEVASRYPGFDPSLQPAAPLDAFTPAQGGMFLIAFRREYPVACAGLQRLDSTTCDVRRVFVREAARGEGVARTLLGALVDSARELGYERARLDTGDRLPEARSLFLSFGFRDIDDYNGNPYAAYWMELPIRRFS